MKELLRLCLDVEVSWVKLSWDDKILLEYYFLILLLFWDLKKLNCLLYFLLGFEKIILMSWDEFKF